MALGAAWKAAEEANLVVQLQEAITTAEIMEGQGTGLTVTLAAGLAELHDRLGRIRNWGGLYGEVDFSPQVKGIIRDREIAPQADPVAMLA
jgi:hypothetical protein